MSTLRALSSLLFTKALAYLLWKQWHVAVPYLHRMRVLFPRLVDKRHSILIRSDQIFWQRRSSRFLQMLNYIDN
ncbi:MAG: hypothetical protein BGO25_12275 [Acidobacteriales bacterium 59-55]|nr:MAG: hypothetical protein BGO25_12275 [Acidobacteriales bacterium 59-55]